MSQQITVYGTNWCSDCRRAKRFLGEQQVRYRWVNVEDDPAGLRIVERHNEDLERAVAAAHDRDGRPL